MQRSTAVAGLPFFILITSLPLAFVSGWVQIFLSSLWTLYYRELRLLDEKSLAPVPE